MWRILCCRLGPLGQKSVSCDVGSSVQDDAWHLPLLTVHNATPRALLSDDTLNSRPSPEWRKEWPPLCLGGVNMPSILSTILHTIRPACIKVNPQTRVIPVTESCPRLWITVLERWITWKQTRIYRRSIRGSTPDSHRLRATGRSSVRMHHQRAAGTWARTLR